MVSIIGGLVGLAGGLMLAFPLSLLDEPLGKLAPAIVSLIFGYLGMNIFSLRSREMLDVINDPGLRAGGAGCSPQRRDSSCWIPVC